MTKYLSILFACMVTALSTLPCFLMDECLFSEAETACSCHSDDDGGCGCADCCSPFMHCSTCFGCVRPEIVVFSKPVETFAAHVVFFYDDSFIAVYHPSIWQPPRA